MEFNSWHKNWLVFALNSVITFVSAFIKNLG